MTRCSAAVAVRAIDFLDRLDSVDRRRLGLGSFGLVDFRWRRSHGDETQERRFPTLLLGGVIIARGDRLLGRHCRSSFGAWVVRDEAVVHAMVVVVDSIFTTCLLLILQGACFAVGLLEASGCVRMSHSLRVWYRMVRGVAVLYHVHHGRTDREL